MKTGRTELEQLKCSEILDFQAAMEARDCAGEDAPESLVLPVLSWATETRRDGAGIGGGAATAQRENGLSYWVDVLMNGVAVLQSWEASSQVSPGELKKWKARCTGSKVVILKRG